MRILVYRFSAFGDVAMVSVVLREFLAQNPHVEIIFVSRPNFAPLFQNLPNTTFYGVDLEKIKGISRLLQFSAKLHKTFNPDFVADLHDVIRTKIMNMYFRYKQIPLKKIDKGSAEKKLLIKNSALNSVPLKSMHERYADVFRKLGFPLVLSHQLIFDEKYREGIGFAPFAQHQGKVIPIEKSFALAERLCTFDKLYLFGGKGEEEKTLRNWANKLPNTECIAGQLSLSQELELIASLRLMVSMDSANMHLASWANTRCISVWGATHHYAGFLGFGQRESDIVEYSPLNCRPCSVFGNKPCHRGDYACLHRLDIEQVIEKVKPLYNTSKREAE